MKMFTQQATIFKDNVIKLQQAKLFLQLVNERNQYLYLILISYRAQPSEVKDREYANFLIGIAPLMDSFFAKLFKIENEVATLKKIATKSATLDECKSKFVQRFAVKKYPKDKLSEIYFNCVSKSLNAMLANNLTEQSLAT